MLDAAGGTAAPLAVCPLASKNPGGTPKVTPLAGVLAVADCPVCQVTEEPPLPSEPPGKTLAEETGAKLKPGFCCPCPQGSPEPCRVSTAGPVAPSGPCGPYVTGGPAGPVILYTGVVPVSKAPVLDTLPAGAVEGLIGAGPLMALKNLSQFFPKIFKRPFTDLPETSHRSLTYLPQICNSQKPKDL